MISPRALLAGLAASMARDEAQAARTTAQAECSTRMREPAPALLDPLAKEDQVLEAQP